jgi:hypothetical protein
MTPIDTIDIQHALQSILGDFAINSKASGQLACHLSLLPLACPAEIKITSYDQSSLVLNSLLTQQEDKRLLNELLEKCDRQDPNRPFIFQSSDWFTKSAKLGKLCESLAYFEEDRVLLLIVIEPGGAIFGCCINWDIEGSIFYIPVDHNKVNNLLSSHTYVSEDDVAITEFLMSWEPPSNNSTPATIHAAAMDTSSNTRKFIHHLRCDGDFVKMFEIDVDKNVLLRPREFMDLSAFARCHTIPLMTVDNVRIYSYEGFWKPNESKAMVDPYLELAVGHYIPLPISNLTKQWLEKRDSFQVEDGITTLRQASMNLKETVKGFFHCKSLEAKILEAVAIHHHFRDLNPFCFTMKAVQAVLSDGANDRKNETINTIVESIRESYSRLSKEASPEAQQAKTAEIVTFNVGGDSVCLLKSSIAYVIPDSQLAIRVLGDWTEDTSTKDVQGRFIIVSVLFFFLFSFFLFSWMSSL